MSVAGTSKDRTMNKIVTLGVIGLLWGSFVSADKYFVPKSENEKNIPVDYGLTQTPYLRGFDLGGLLGSREC